MRGYNWDPVISGRRAIDRVLPIFSCKMRRWSDVSSVYNKARKKLPGVIYVSRC